MSGTWSIGGVDLGIMQSETPDVQTGLQTISIPGLSSSNAVNIALTGPTNTLTCTFIKTFLSLAASQQWEFQGSGGTGTLANPDPNSFRGVIDSSSVAAGLQIQPTQYISDRYGTVNVAIQEFDGPTFDVGAAYMRCTATITLVVVQ